MLADLQSSRKAICDCKCNMIIGLIISEIVFISVIEP